MSAVTVVLSILSILRVGRFSPSKLWHRARGIDPYAGPSKDGQHDARNADNQHGSADCVADCEASDGGPSLVNPLAPGPAFEVPWAGYVAWILEATSGKAVVAFIRCRPQSEYRWPEVGGRRRGKRSPNLSASVLFEGRRLSEVVKHGDYFFAPIVGSAMSA